MLRVSARKIPKTAILESQLPRNASVPVFFTVYATLLVFFLCALLDHFSSKYSKGMPLLQTKALL
jgi:hypothetical protein